MHDSVNLTSVVAFLVGVVATARATRLLAQDHWPPVIRLRNWWIGKVPLDWGILVECPFCLSPWLGLPNVLLAWASGLAWWWWVPNLWFAGAYLAAIVVVRDEPEDDREHA